MERIAKAKADIQEVHKPFLLGAWHGKDAWQLAGKVMLCIPVVSVVYLFLSLLLSFDSLAWRIVFSAATVLLAASYLYGMGLRKGESDASFAEIMYSREAEGNQITGLERERCFHPAKGFFAAFTGVLPYIILTAVFACMTSPIEYTLGSLPGWTRDLLRQNEFGDALQYYAVEQGIRVMDIYRILVRAMVMPFVNVAMLLGNPAIFWTERLSPLLVCLAPLGFGFGYRSGLKARVRVNTGILIGDTKKKNKERKEKKRRRNSPERLI